jgi:hypothetical protein
MNRFMRPRPCENAHNEALTLESAMPSKTVLAARCGVVAVLALAIFLVIQVAVAAAAGPETLAMPQVVGQQLPTPTPFRFLTPAPGAQLPSTTTSTTSATPRAGGIPLELALPALAGGLAAIGGGTFLLRRRKPA